MVLLQYEISSTENPVRENYKLFDLLFDLSMVKIIYTVFPKCRR